MHQHQARGSARGFTLIELLVVVAILAMLATIASIELRRARITTNEQLALNSLRLLAKSCQFFFLVRNVYPTSLTELGPPTSDPPYVDQSLTVASPIKQGYAFTYTNPAPLSFTLLANPEVYSVTGVRHFYTDQTLVIHGTQEDRDATIGDPVVP